MTMTSKIHAEYVNVLCAVVLAKGALTDPGPHTYGWIAQDWQHKHTCQLSSTAVPVEAEWTEFGGSFTEHHPTKHGIDLSHVSCACGQVQDRTLRWDANPYEMMAAVFEEMHRVRTTA